jgi:hypothetical protein
MTDEIKNLTVLIGTIITVALQFWGLRKPAETKIQILLWLAEIKWRCSHNHRCLFWKDD